MIRRTLAALVFSLGVAFAQQNESETPPPADPQWSISIHPFSMIVFTALRMPSLYVTAERAITTKTSLIVRPAFIYATSDAYDISSTNSFDLYLAGITLGGRYYFSQGHSGVYVDAQFQYAHVGVDYSGSDGSASVSANVFGPFAQIGWKSGGRIVFSIDAGFGYNIMSATAKGETASEEDVENVAGKGFVRDSNLTLGLAF